MISKNPTKWLKNCINIQIPNNVQQCLSFGPKFNLYNDKIEKNTIIEITKNTEAKEM